MKLQITLTKQEEELISAKAGILGYDVTRYVKFLLAREAISAAPPVYLMADELEKAIDRAIKIDNNGKTKEWSFDIK